jgi:hypothetical protein
VVSSPVAVKALRSGSKLDYAYRLTKGYSQDFIGLLYEAEATIRQAAGVVATVDFDSSALKLAREIGENVSLIVSTLERKKKEG